ncbi:MAG TPA: hypothetical protein VG733_07420 [Chthoniobacteraceae bacterium]|nr:hypothetical protein [Chthoniobacteraceae bacterium]
MQTFRINASEKEITLTATLTGEEKPIEVRAKYRFEREGEKTVLVFDDVRFSREWANNLYNDFVRPEHKRVPLKWHEAAAAKMVL